MGSDGEANEAVKYDIDNRNGRGGNLLVCQHFDLLHY